MELSNTGDAELKDIQIAVQNLPDVHVVIPNSTIDLAPGEKLEIELDADKASTDGEKGTLNIQASQQSLSVPVEVTASDAALSFKSSVAELGAGNQASYTLINNAKDSAENLSITIILADSDTQANGIVISNNSCTGNNLLKTTQNFHKVISNASHISFCCS